MELFPTNQDTPSLPYLRITTKLLSIFKIKLFPPHPSVAPSSQVDRNNPSWDLGRLFKAALLRDDIQPPLLSHWGSWDRCQHTPSHVCHCINLQGEAERVGSFLKKVLRWRTKGNLPPGNKTRASWHSWCVLLHPQTWRSAYTTSSSALSHSPLSSKACGFYQKGKATMTLCVSSNRSVLNCKVILREMIRAAQWRKNWLVLKLILKTKTLVILQHWKSVIQFL